MKKSVILLISVIYLVSIVVVTFFGMQISMDQFKVYMSSIQLSHSEIQIMDDGSKYLYVEFDQDKIDADGYISVFIDYISTPNNASNPALVSFKLSNATYTDPDGTVTTYAEVTNNGEVVFYQKRMVTLYIYTEDGSNLSDSLIIGCF